MSQESPNHRHFFSAAFFSLLPLVNAGDAGVGVFSNHAPISSEEGDMNGRASSDEVGDRKRRRSRRSDEAAREGGAARHQQFGDVRNKYRIEIPDDPKNTGNAMPELRIINGLSAPELRYPYSASLQYNGQHFCGGALVSPNVVITAAHCTSVPSKITLGRYDLDSRNDNDYEVLDVIENVIHPYYDETMVENDLALLILERDSVHPFVRINDNMGVPSDGEKLAVMGWGDIDPSEHGQKTSDELRETDVWFLPNRKCEESEGYVKTDEGVVFGNYKGAISTSMMCALDYIGTTSDACQGDSGGALVKPGSNNRGRDDVLVGLVSWGYGCADPNFPGVYSRLSAYYHDFLQPAICLYSLDPPSYLNCDPGSGNMGPITTLAPMMTPAGLLTIFVQTDPFSPEDLGWELTSVPDGEVIAFHNIGHYGNKYGKSVSEEVIVEPENFYRLKIFDSGRDGFRGELAVVRGRRYVKSDALVYEPGFTHVSGSSVVHGFYVGDNPPRMLTLDLTFDKNPQDLAWSVTNVDDDLPLGFKWFDWYPKGLTRTTEMIPIYGDDRGPQEYTFTVLDLAGNGMCCREGRGSFSLHLDGSDSVNPIAEGGKFTTDESFTFKIGSGSLFNAPAPPTSNPPTRRPTEYPTRKPTPLPDTPVQFGYYMAPSTGICQLTDYSKQSRQKQVFVDYDECCQYSWNREQCIAAKPIDGPILPSPPANSNSNTITFTPVTGKFTCKAAGLACTIKCNQCGTIKLATSGMKVESPNKSTIVYTTKRGSNYFPDDPSRLVLVESDNSAGNTISCDEGCECTSVNDYVLGCGMLMDVNSRPVGPSSIRPSDVVNVSARMGPSGFFLLCGLFSWRILR